jgi:pyridoxine kinase
MASFAMQSLGCDVAALNTVHFSKSYRVSRPRCIPFTSHETKPRQFFPTAGSNGLIQIGNHTGYRQFKGTRATAQEITDLYQGLCQSNLTDFDVMLSGYAPSAAAVEAVGAIGMDLKKKSEKPGSFFWGK